MTAEAAAAKVSVLLGQGTVQLEPYVARVDADRCTGSGECVHEAGVLSGLIGTTVERVESPEVVNSRAYLVRTGV